MTFSRTRWVDRLTSALGRSARARQGAYLFTAAALLLQATDRAAAQLNVTMTKIGEPAFDVVDVNLFSGDFTNLKFAFLTDPLLSVVPHWGYLFDPLAGPDPFVAGPTAPQSPPFETESRDGIAAAGYKTGTVFNRFDMNEGILLVYTQLPNALAPMGKTFDYDMGPVLPEDAYPYTDNRQVRLEGNLVFENEIELIPLSAVPDNLVDAAGNPISYAGLLESHSHNFSYISAGFDLPAELVIGRFDWQIRLLDAAGNGWQFNVPFQVVPEPGTLVMLILGGLGAVVLISRHFSRNPQP